MRRRLCWIALTLAAVLLGGCGLWKHHPGNDSANDIMARDLIRALVQIEGKKPENTVAQFKIENLESNAFLETVRLSMSRQGYGIRQVSLGDSDALVQHESEQAEDGSGITHTLSVGTVQLRRRYRQDNTGQWSPDGPLLVRGADASSVRMSPDSFEVVAPAVSMASVAPVDDSHAEQTEESSLSSADRVELPAVMSTSDNRSGKTREEPGNAAAVKRLALLDTDTDTDTDTGAGPGASLSTGADARGKPSRSSEPDIEIDAVTGQPVLSGVVGKQPDVLVPRNIMELGASNYTNAFDELKDVEELVLIFPNDSLTLGEENKRRIRESVARYDDSRDVYSIVGCSVGPTAISNGNEVLALGRASRVREELLFAGVSGQHILDEGCWADSSTDSAVAFPNRGVVLTLKRRGV